jgi:hypothetical protein
VTSLVMPTKQTQRLLAAGSPNRQTWVSRAIRSHEGDRPLPRRPAWIRAIVRSPKGWPKRSPRERKAIVRSSVNVAGPSRTDSAREPRSSRTSTRVSLRASAAAPTAPSTAPTVDVTPRTPTPSATRSRPLALCISAADAIAYSSKRALPTATPPRSNAPLNHSRPGQANQAPASPPHGSTSIASRC